MLDLNVIKKSYSENLQSFDKFILREYLQYKILQIIFDSQYRDKMCFIGGTALRIVHNNNRFSEDLDFDNFDLSQDEFIDLTSIIKRRLEEQGFSLEVKNVFKNAFRCYLRFTRILNSLGLSGYEEEKLLIQIDSTNESFSYNPEDRILNKFDVFTKIKVAPKDILLSKKIGAILNRKTKKGRDFFDVVFLFSLTMPNYDILSAKENVNNLSDLKKILLEVIEEVDLRELSNDVLPFLINPEEIKRVHLFEEFVRQLK